MLLIIVLIIVGVLGGLCQSIAGLASLVSYPSLLALGLPPVTANVTNTVSMVFSGFSSTVSSQRDLKGSKQELITVMPIMLLGCITGAMLLFVIPAKAFEKVVPFFILFAAIAELVPHNARKTEVKTSSRILALFGVFLVGTYSGYFGAAAGVLMLALLGMISSFSFITYNAEKNVSFAAANIISSIVYGLHTKLLWGWILPLGIGFLIGGFLGPKIVRHVRIRLLQVLISIGAVGLAISLFMQAYF